MALSICVAVSANWPEYAIIKPILTVSCAFAEKAANIAAAMASIVFRMISLPVAVQKGGGLLIMLALFGVCVTEMYGAADFGTATSVSMMQPIRSVCLPAK